MYCGKKGNFNSQSRTGWSYCYRMNLADSVIIRPISICRWPVPLGLIPYLAEIIIVWVCDFNLSVLILKHNAFLQFTRSNSSFYYYLLIGVFCIHTFANKETEMLGCFSVILYIVYCPSNCRLISLLGMSVSFFCAFLRWIVFKAKSGNIDKPNTCHIARSAAQGR